MEVRELAEPSPVLLTAEQQRIAVAQIERLGGDVLHCAYCGTDEVSVTLCMG
jgi:hypothetical protein